MKALLLVAHGSRRTASNDEVRELADRLRAVATEYDVVDSAFLELAEPSIPDGIEQSIQKGATDITVLPYFLSAGRHVATDIPEEVEGKVKEYPEINIEIVPYLGTSAQIPNILLQLAQQRG